MINYLTTASLLVWLFALILLLVIRVPHYYWASALEPGRLCGPFENLTGFQEDLILWIKSAAPTRTIYEALLNFPTMLLLILLLIANSSFKVNQRDLEERRVNDQVKDY